MNKISIYALTFFLSLPINILYAYAIHGRYGVYGLSAFDGMIKYIAPLFVSKNNLLIKTVQKEMEYTIQKKETMYRICRKFDISSAELLRLNTRSLSAGSYGMYSYLLCRKVR